MFAADVYGSRRGQRFHHQAHRWHISLIDIDDRYTLVNSGLNVDSIHLSLIFFIERKKEMIGRSLSIYPCSLDKERHG